MVRYQHLILSGRVFYVAGNTANQKDFYQHLVLGRFLVHDREDEKMELFVTKNFGETFSHAGDYIKSFYFDHREVP